jgi:hypothetical protein
VVKKFNETKQIKLSIIKVIFLCKKEIMCNKVLQKRHVSLQDAVPNNCSQHGASVELEAFFSIKTSVFYIKF